jgi:putative SOS response-associated peptidase YedK
VCTNYRPGARDYIRDHLGAEPHGTFREEAYPGYDAPIVRWSPDGGRECVAARFGLVPYWAKDAKIGRNTYNARSETVAEKPSFRTAWRRRQFCLVPIDWFYEPNYESGRAVRWRIGLASGDPFAAAGIWDRWVDPGTGEIVHSFSMLTVNADGHPVMGRMHRPEDEKRCIVPVRGPDMQAWLEGHPDGLLAVPGPQELQTQAAPAVLK